MIQVPAELVEVSYSNASNVLIQNKSKHNVFFTTDPNEEIWGELEGGKFLEVPSGNTVFFKSKIACTLATIPFQ